MKVQSNHYVLAVADLSRSRDWFARVLGCRTEVVDEGNWEFYHIDGVTFMCGHCPDAIPVPDLGDHQYFAYLEVDDVDAFHARAEQEGAEILKPPRNEPWGMRKCALRTADGHRLMLATRLPRD